MTEQVVWCDAMPVSYTHLKKCGGNCSFTESGIKDCSGCLVPHRRENYGRIVARFGELCEMIKE